MELTQAVLRFQMVGNPKGRQDLWSQVRILMELTQAVLRFQMVGNPEGRRELQSQVRAPMELTQAELRSPTIVVLPKNLRPWRLTP